jgi:GNAT superfamily N-acetyltransferase
MDFSITRADSQDASEILILQKLAYQSEARLNDDWTIPPLTQTLAEMEKDIDTMMVLKAVAGNRIIGSVRAHESSGTCFIGRLIVHPDYQKGGIGSALMNAIETAFSKTDRFELFTGTKSIDNIRLYEKLGYTQYRFEDLSPKVRIVFLEKNKPIFL